MHDIEDLDRAIGRSNCWTIAFFELQRRGQTHIHWLMTSSIPSTPCIQRQKNLGGLHVNQTQHVLTALLHLIPFFTTIHQYKYIFEDRSLRNPQMPTAESYLLHYVRKSLGPPAFFLTITQPFDDHTLPCLANSSASAHADAYGVSWLSSVD